MKINYQKHYLKLLLLAVLVFGANAVYPQEMIVEQAVVNELNDDYYLSATVKIKLNDVLEEALKKGVTLYFVSDFELGNKRWYTLYLWHMPVVKYSQSYGLSFNALTRNYRLTYGGLHQSFNNLGDALAVLGKIGRPKVIAHYHLKSGRKYIAKLRMRLDTTRLPKPFQINAIGSRDWNLSSDWFSWQITK